MEEKLFEIEDGVLTKYNGNEKDVVIPEGVSEIGDLAFERCTSIKSVIIPKGVRTIRRNTFSRCTSLESVVIPDGVMAIDNWAFVDCASLKAVTIPGSVRQIGCGAFERCSSLTSADISDGVTVIGERAFAGCTSLESISIPASVMEIDRYWTEFDDCLAGEQRNSLYPFDLFDGCTSIKEIRYGGTKAQWLFMLGGFNLVSPVRVAVSCSDGDARSVRSDLLRRRKMTEIALPGNIVKIASRAFAGCESLASVKIPGSVVMICSEAFKGCASLSSVEYDDTMEEWERVEGKENLLSYIPATEVKCSDGVWIRPAVLVECGTLITCLDKDTVSMMVPDGVTGISGEVFNGCKSLTSISIPASVTEIFGGTFEDCTSLISVEYEDTMEEWETVEGKANLLAYAPVKAVKCTDGVWKKPAVLVEHGVAVKCLDKDAVSIAVPDGVIEIGDKAFERCTSLESVLIPVSITKIGMDAFAGCTSLKTVSIPEGVPKIGWGAFAGCTSLESICMPAGVTSILGLAFKGCTSLREIRYGGTKKQWDTVKKDYDWCRSVPARKVICTDGESDNLKVLEDW